MTLGLQRLARTLGPLRSEQWWGRLRRVVVEGMDRRPPGWWAERPLRGAAVRLRRGDGPWPAWAYGEGHPQGDELMSGVVRVLDQPASWRGGWPWGAAERGPLFVLPLHGFAMVDPLLAQGQRGAEVIRDAMDHWMATQPIPARPAWHPYTLSRRIQAWAKALALSQLPGDEARIRSLGTQVEALIDRRELDLQANHLWENAVAIELARAVLEGPERWGLVSEPLLRKVLGEQLLPAGGHEERTAMYHAVLTAGLLDLLAARRRAGLPEGEVRGAAERMLRWLERVSPRSGRLPQLNDAAPGPAPTLGSLRAGAAALGLAVPAPRDGAEVLDGWVVCRAGGHHLLFDAAQVGAEHQPGHAHADTLSFEWIVADAPIVVDPGVAGYHQDPHRGWGRSTAAHATVALEGEDSAELWGTFRIGRRPAQCEVLPPRALRTPRGVAWALGGSHDGYRHLDGAPIHRRTLVVWAIDDARSVLWIADRVLGGPAAGVSRLPLERGLGWDPASGRLTGRQGEVRGFGFDAIEVVAGRVSACMGRWEPSQVIAGSFSPSRATGWVLLVGEGLSLVEGEALEVHLDGRRLASVPRPDQVEEPDRLWP
ncbi:MAG: heparinase II/III-family protein [Deltaproteobacteria bacterium]|nr:heparinase II/III-family protein [Deltaproteobacteria bacterium]